MPLLLRALTLRFKLGEPKGSIHGCIEFFKLIFPQVAYTLSLHRLRLLISFLPLRACFPLYLPPLTQTVVPPLVVSNLPPVLCLYVPPAIFCIRTYIPQISRDNLSHALEMPRLLSLHLDHLLYTT